MLRIGDIEIEGLRRVLSAYGMELVQLAAGAPIPGSHWGEPEAGLEAHRLYVRPDTPVHSALHEACHYVCMSPARRVRLNGDAGGDYAEENGVCYLQILLAEHLPEVGARRLMADMDTWGYSFRLGSAAAWFTRDAADARDWLEERGVVDVAGRPSWVLRSAG